VLDRRTGQVLTDVEQRPAPGGGVEPERRTATQPFSLYQTLRKPDLTERDMWGMSPVDQMLCRIQFREAAYEGIYTPPTSDTHWIQYPGYNGGSDWRGVSLDPQRGVIIANYNDMPNYNRLVPRANGPFRIPSMLPLEIGTPNNGGSVITAGGHHFVETPRGDYVIAYALPGTD